MVKNFNAQYQDQNIGVRLSGAGCGLLGIVCTACFPLTGLKILGREVDVELGEVLHEYQYQISQYS